jgi:ABC-type amino acid transport substrate-binding protein
MTMIRSSRRMFLAGVGGALLGGRPSAAETVSPTLRTINPGMLTVATAGELPMAGVEGSQLLGTDGEMISMIAARLGLKIQPALMEWSATVQSVRSGRADVMLGNMAWTPTRATVLLLTDPIYYAATYVAMRADQPFTQSITVADLKGRSVGTGTGGSNVPDMKKIPGVGDVKLYDGADPCVRDVVAGRLDFAFLDGPLIDYMIEKNPNWSLKQIPIVYDASLPTLTSKQYTVFGMNQDNPDLFDAVNSGIAWLWRTQKNAAALQHYGVKNPDYLIPPPLARRVGVDRSSDNDLSGPGSHFRKDFSGVFS